MAVRDICNRALREIGVLGAGDDPDAPEINDALVTFNTMQLSMFGDSIGPRLTAADVSASRTVENGERLQIRTAGATLTLPSNPKAGARFGVVLVGGTGTIAPNGRFINGAASSITAAAGSWFFRDDTGNWEKERSLMLDEEPYFDPVLHEPLVYMLAVRLAPQFGEAQTLTPTIQTLAIQGRELFVARYGRRGRNQPKLTQGSARTQAEFQRAAV